MKSWNQIALWGLLIGMSLFYFSCSEEKEIIPNQIDQTTDEGYLSFRLNTNAVEATTRTSTDYGTPEERKVSKIYLLLYNEGGNSGKLMVRKEIRATNTGGTFAGDDVVDRTGIPRDENKFVIKAISLKRQNYQMVLLVNPTATILGKAIENSSTLADLLTVVTETQANDYNTTDGFFMTNAGGVIQILKSDIKDGTIIAEENPLSVPVERLLAKVFVFENKTQGLPEVSSGGTIESVTWGLDVTNKQTYLVRIQDKLKGGATFERGFNTDRSLVYAKDPNFTGNKNIINNDQERNKHFATLNVLGTTGFQSWNAFGEQAKYYQYILENTLTPEEQNVTDIDPLSYMTHVVLKVIISNPGKTITEADYYSFSYKNAQNKREWKAFTHAQAVEWFNGTYPSDMPASLHAALVEAQAQSGSPFKFEIINQVVPTPPATYASVATSKGQVTFHKGGLNIYRVPIMHFGVDGGMTNSDYGYYGIVRNNTYNLIINAINGPGTNTSDEGYLSTQITINPWFERGWDEDLKPMNPFN